MNKKVKIVLLVLILILLVLIIRSTYSKYIAESDATIEKNIAVWSVKVNDTDITLEPEKKTEFNITGSDIVWEAASHVENGKVAPGMKGYFYIRIDSTGTQTALIYTLNIDMNPIFDKHINFVINDITEENGKEIRLLKDGKKYSIQRIKSLNENSNPTESIDRIKINIEWVDDEQYDKFDTKLGETVDEDFKIPVEVNAKQYTGEGYDF